MARRKGPRVTQFFNRDRLAFSAMHKVGHVTLEHLHQCGLADSRIKNLIRDGHFEKIPFKKNGRNEECYKLTKLGRETAARLWALNYAYHAQSPIHDLAVAEKYFNLPEKLRDSWKTETEIRNQFFEQLELLREQGKEVEAKLYDDQLNKGLISMPDAAYINESGLVTGFEVITNSYGVEELMAKEALVQIMNYNYETIRI
ncbi:hypothetical protein M3647_21135 [Paenibacillus cellulositrophicus]|uniref:hypothetical protein n=1 Tax=Paenibacillus cellulositrophicus TaxID=562959 RepID=UPI0020423D63|nr:hypothetical protein [Paenibacillus cellulositrophicus]MCM2999983.1 hypothetical protein [Paenibacillus cellulositrophicus]